MAHAYSHLYNLPTTGLRFFTVYGPGATRYGFISIYQINNRRKTNKVFNNGNMVRDFTYIDDIIESIFRLIKKPPNHQLIKI